MGYGHYTRVRADPSVVNINAGEEININDDTTMRRIHKSRRTGSLLV